MLIQNKFFEPFSYICLQLFEKVIIRANIFCNSSIWARKTPKFHSEIESVETVAKSSNKKLITKKWRKKEFFLLLLLCAKFPTFNFFGWTFLLCFQRIQTQPQILRFLNPYWMFTQKQLSYISTCANFEANAH